PVRLAYLGLLAVPVWLTRSPRSRAAVITAFVAGTTVAAFEAIYQMFGQVSFRPDGNLGNANLLGALIAMAIPLAASRGLRGGTLSPFWWAAIVVLAGGLYASTSRSGAVGALAGCAVLAVLALRGRAAVAAAVAGAGVVGAALAAIVLTPLRELNGDPGPARIHLWHDAVAFIAARPLTGWGEDTTGLALGRYLTANWSPGVTFDRLHSCPLDLAATQGLVGVAALSWVLWTFARGTWRQRRSEGVAALVAACAGYTAWVLFNFDWAPATGAFWLLAGTAWASATAGGAPAEGADAPQSEMRSSGWRSVLAVGLALVAVGLAVLPVLADAWYYAGRSDLSVAVSPLQARYHWARGDELVARGSTAAGVAELQRAADLGETEPTLYVDLGDRLQSLGRTADAIRAYRRALEIDPYYDPAIQRLAA
ncbi:MAG TPA: O-antigen ligase family protein, partial [Patescibacteria group bacterium]|nr:O-antigen ligase family protein [Patescibacteria group bacterium]